MLAGACATSLTVATAKVTASADEASASTAVTYTLSDVFAPSANEHVALNEKSGYAAITLDDNTTESASTPYAYYKRDLAFYWQEKKAEATTATPAYLNIKFAFDALNFNSVTFAFESDTSVANEEDKAYNAIEFKVDGGAVKAAVVKKDTKDEEKSFKALPATVVAGEEIEIALSKGTVFDSFKVTVAGVEIGEFTHVGANYAEYANGKNPLTISADTEGETKTTVILKEINGQSFAVADGKITDNAAPVLVVNDTVNGFQFGTAFSLDYKVIDVMQSTRPTPTAEFYQYNPTDTELKYHSLDASTSSTTYFAATVYTDSEGVSHNLFKEEGCEYVSVKFTIEDKAKQKAVYELAWYVDEDDRADVIKTPAATGSNQTSVEYIVVDDYDAGPTYNYIALDDINKVNTPDDALQNAALQAQVALYEERLQKAIEESTTAYAGGKLTIPDVEWLIDDDGGYKALSFTISYKTAKSSSPRTVSNANYDALSITLNEESVYEFKIFAKDKAGNTMKYYLDEELVEVTTGNVWQIEAIPSFSFEIVDTPIGVKNPTKDSDKKVEKLLDQDYTLTGLTVTGASNQNSDYALYRFENKPSNVTDSILTGIEYNAIRDKAKSKLDQVGDGKTYADYFELYIATYAELIAEKTGGNAADIASCFVRIDEYNSNITEDDEEWEEYNKYQWKPASKKFTAAEQGTYFIFADFWEGEIPQQRATGYKMIVVNSKADVIKGDSVVWQWFKNNKVSVILFGIAGLMLIAIIVLLFVKPSDEQLEDVEKKAAKKASKKAKKAKKKGK